MDVKERKRRKWEFYEGDTRFWCQGSILHLKFSDSLHFLCHLVLTLSNFALFMIFTAPPLSVKLGLWIPIVTIILFVYTMINMLAASFMDPGIMPHARSFEISDTMSQVQSLLPNGVFLKDTKIPLDVNGQVINLKYCYTCKFFKPPRVGHCAYCNNCVDRLDHHCPWINNCIGRRNYSKFYSFLVIGTISSLSGLAFSILHVTMAVKESESPWAIVSEAPVSSYLVLASFILAVPTLGLTGYHTYLLCKGITTREEMKETWDEYNQNPFDRGSRCGNYFGTLCEPRPYPYLDAHGFADEDFLDDLDVKSQEKSQPSSLKIESP